MTGSGLHLIKQTVCLFDDVEQKWWLVEVFERQFRRKEVTGAAVGLMRWHEPFFSKLTGRTVQRNQGYLWDDREHLKNHTGMSTINYLIPELAQLSKSVTDMKYEVFVVVTWSVEALADEYSESLHTGLTLAQASVIYCSCLLTVNVISMEKSQKRHDFQALCNHIHKCYLLNLFKYFFFFAVWFLIASLFCWLHLKPQK